MYLGQNLSKNRVIGIAFYILIFWIILFFYKGFSVLLLVATILIVLLLVTWRLFFSHKLKIINQYNQEILEFAKNNHLHNLQENEIINPYKNKTTDKEIFNFKKADQQTIYNFIWGDYQNKKVQTYNFRFVWQNNSLFLNKYTMVEVEIPEIDKHLILRPEHALQEDPFDIDTESVEFNKMYHVISKDPKFAYDVLDPLFMQELMKYREYKFEISENSLLIYTKNEISIEKIQEMLNLGITLVKILEKNL